MTWLKKLLKGSKGFSLIELIISIAIMSIITAGIGAAVVSATRNYSRGTTEVDLQTNAQNITNIITNLIVDSAEASSDASGNCSSDGTSLYITSIDSGCYAITFVPDDNSNGTGSLYYAEGSSYDKCTDARLLSDNVIGFTADTSTYGTDYTVHVTIDLSYPSEKRTYQSTFSATSRNAAGAGSYIDNLDGAAVVCDTMVVIEPNESYANKSSLALDCSVITSGSVTDDTYSFYILNNSTDTVDKAVSSTDSGLIVEKGTGTYAGKLVLSANAYLKPNSSGYLYIKVVTNAKDASGNYYDSKIITVNVRKVVSATITKDKTASTTSTNQAGSIHVVTGKLSIYNPERFYALNSDSDYNEPTYSVYDVIWNVSCLNKNGNNISYYLESVKLDNGTDILSQLISTQGYKGTSGEKFTIKLKNSLPKGEVITFTMSPIHPQGLYTYDSSTFVANKASLAAYNGGTATARTYPFTPAYYRISSGFFSEISDYQRGNTLIGQGFGSGDTNTIFNDLFADKYKEYSALYAGDNNGSDGQNSYADVVKWLEDFKNGNINYEVGYFYRIKDYTIDSSGNTVVVSDWSQYRSMGENSITYAFRKSGDYAPYDGTSTGGILATKGQGMTDRLDGRYYQSVEFVVVLYDDDSDQILWPNYSALRDYGFGESDKHFGVGYSMSPIASSITDEYSSYALTFDIVPAAIEYYANSTLGTSAGASIGSTSDPAILGDSSVGIAYDQINWVGLDSNVYQNVISGILEQNSGSGWTKIATFGKGAGGEYYCSDGGFRVRTTNMLYEINLDGMATTDFDSVYRFIPTISNFRLGYIKEDETIFGTNVYWDSDHVITYTMADGDMSNIYDDPLKGTVTFKRYGNTKDIDLILNDSDDMTVYSTVKFRTGKGFIDSLPTPSRENYVFTGWYTAYEGGTEVTSSTKTLNVDKLYAHWVDPKATQYELTLVSKTTSSSGFWYGGAECGAITYTYKFTNYTSSDINVGASFIMDDKAVSTWATSSGIVVDGNEWIYTGTLGATGTWNSSVTITISLYNNGTEGVLSKNCGLNGN